MKNKHPIILNPSPKQYSVVCDWLIVTNINEGQQLNYTYIKAVDVSVMDFDTIVADTVTIKFQESIERIEQNGIKYQL